MDGRASPRSRSTESSKRGGLTRLTWAHRPPESTVDSYSPTPGCLSPRLADAVGGHPERRPRREPTHEHPSRPNGPSSSSRTARRYVGRAYGAAGHHARRGRLRHRHDRLPGDPHRPVVPPARSSLQTAPHIGNTGNERRGTPESPSHLGRRDTSCATPPVWCRTGAPTQASTTTLAAHGVVGISGIERAPSPATSARPAACAPASSRRRRARRRRPSEQLRAGAGEAPQMAVAHLARGELFRQRCRALRRSTPAPASASAHRRRRSTSASRQSTPRLPCARAASTCTWSRSVDRSSDDAAGSTWARLFLLQRPGRPAASGDHVELLRGVLRRAVAVLRHLLRQPDARPCPRASAPTSCRSGTAASTSPCPTSRTGASRSRRTTTGSRSRRPIDGEPSPARTATDASR